MKNLLFILALFVILTNAYAQSEIIAFSSQPKSEDSIQCVVNDSTESLWFERLGELSEERVNVRHEKAAHGHSVITGSGPQIKAGDTVHGIVRDSVGPLCVFISEKTDRNTIANFTMSDERGQFDLKISDTASAINVDIKGYYPVSCPIANSQYDILLQMNPETFVERPVIYDKPELRTGGRSYTMAYPFLIMNGKFLEDEDVDTSFMKGIDFTKDTFSMEELSRLFGIEADKIREVEVLKGKSAAKAYGSSGRNGVIMIDTRTKKEKRAQREPKWTRYSR